MNTDIEKIIQINKFFKDVTILKFLMTLKQLTFNKEKAEIKKLIQLKNYTNCSICEIAAVNYMPEQFKSFIFSYPFQLRCNYLLLEIIKNNLNADNFSDTFVIELTRDERLELSLHYNKKFYISKSNDE